MTGFLAPGESECACEMRARKELEDEYDWLKDCMCMYHWMQTDHYRAKLTGETVPQQTIRALREIAEKRKKDDGDE